MSEWRTAARAAPVEVWASHMGEWSRGGGYSDGPYQQMPQLLQDLESHDPARITKALKRIKNAACHQINRLQIRDLGGIPLLIKFVEHGNSYQKEQAAAALWSVATLDECSVTIREEGGIRPLIRMVNLRERRVRALSVPFLRRSRLQPAFPRLSSLLGLPAGLARFPPVPSWADCPFLRSSSTERRRR